MVGERFNPHTPCKKIKFFLKRLVPKSTSFTQQISHQGHSINVGISNFDVDHKILTIFQLKNGDYKIRVK